MHSHAGSFHTPRVQSAFGIDGRMGGFICLNLKVEPRGCLQGEQTKPGQEAGNSTPRTRREGERAELLREQGSAARLSGTVHHPNPPAPPIQQAARHQSPRNPHHQRWAAARQAIRQARTDAKLKQHILYTCLEYSLDHRLCSDRELCTPPQSKVSRPGLTRVEVFRI